MDRASVARSVAVFLCLVLAGTGLCQSAPWSISICARGGSAVAYGHTELHSLAGGLTGIDQYDVPEPPHLPSAYVTAPTSRSDSDPRWALQPLPHVRYRSESLSLGEDESAQFPIELSTDQAGVVELSWTITNASALAYRHVVLHDNVSGQEIDMHDSSTYSITAVAGTRSLTLSISPGRCPVPAAVQDLTATDAEFDEKVVLSWSPEEFADSYGVYRGTSSSTESAVLVGTSSLPWFEDHVPSRTTLYTYYVVGISDCGSEGAASNSAQGRAQCLPADPPEVSASDGLTTYVLVNWPAVAGATGYDLSRNTTITLEGAVGLSTNTLETSFTDYEVEPYGVYYYFVRVNTVCGAGNWSVGDPGHRGCVIFGATNISATNGPTPGTIQVQWKGDDTATSYVVARSTEPAAATFYEIAETTGTSLVDTPSSTPGELVGTTLYYWIISQNDCGYGPISEAGDTSVALECAEPPSVVATATQELYPNKIVVTWPASATATSYRVYRATSAAETPTFLDSVVGLKFTDANVGKGSTIYYAVHPANACGEQPTAETCIGRTSCPVPPESPYEVHADRETSSSDALLVRWTMNVDVSEEYTFDVFKSTSEDFGSSSLVAGGLSEQTFRDTAVRKGVTYYYWVRACNECGAGPVSISVAGTIPDTERDFVTLVVESLREAIRKNRGTPADCVQIRSLATWLCNYMRQWNDYYASLADELKYRLPQLAYCIDTESILRILDQFDARRPYQFRTSLDNDNKARKILLDEATSWTVAITNCGVSSQKYDVAVLDVPELTSVTVSNAAVTLEPGQTTPAPVPVVVIDQNSTCPRTLQFKIRITPESMPDWYVEKTVSIEVVDVVCDVIQAYAIPAVIGTNTSTTIQAKLVNRTGNARDVVVSTTLLNASMASTGKTSTTVLRLEASDACTTADIASFAAGDLTTGTCFAITSAALADGRYAGTTATAEFYNVSAVAGAETAARQSIVLPGNSAVDIVTTLTDLIPRVFPAEYDNQDRVPVDARVICDDGFQLCTGTQERIVGYFPGYDDSLDARGIVHKDGNAYSLAPQFYTVSGGLASGEYIYLLAWSNMMQSQYLAADFCAGGGLPVISMGDTDWQVFATDVYTTVGDVTYRPMGQPTTSQGLADVNAQISLANDGHSPKSESSQGWAGLSSRSGVKGLFYHVPEARDQDMLDTGMQRWVGWYSDGTQKSDGTLKDPTVAYLGLKHYEYLIFRIKVADPHWVRSRWNLFQHCASGYNVTAQSVSPTTGSAILGNVVAWRDFPYFGARYMHAFSSSGTVVNGIPGEIRFLTDSTDVQTTYLQSVVDNSAVYSTTSLHLAPLSVSVARVIGLDQPSLMLDRGTTAALAVSLSNPTETATTVTLTAEGLQSLYPQYPSSVYVPQGTTVTAHIGIRVRKSAMSGETSYTVSALLSNGGLDRASGVVSVSNNVDFEPDPPALTVEVQETSSVAGLGRAQEFVVIVTNIGVQSAAISLAAICPAGFTGQIDSGVIWVAPGATNAYHANVTLVQVADTAAGNHPFTITATLADHPELSYSGAGNVVGSHHGIALEFLPSSCSPGGTLQLRVTNAASEQDTISLVMHGAGASLLSAGPAHVVLAAGASVSVNYSIASRWSELPEVLDVTALANSAGDSTVHGSAFAQIEVGSDAVPPVVSMASHIPNPSTETALHMSGSASDAESGIATVLWRSNYGEWAPATYAPATGAFGFDVPSASDGIYNIDVQATDQAGNVSGDSQRLVVDRAAPDIRIVSPDAFGSTDTVHVTAEVSDYPAGITTVTCSILRDGDDTTYPMTLISGDETTGTYDVLVAGDSVSSEGQYVLLVSGVDLAGNAGETSASFVIDLTAPQVTLETSATDPTSLAAIPFSAQFSEPVTGFGLGGIQVANGTAADLTQVGNRYDFVVTPAADGPVTVQVAAGAGRDAAGNPSLASEPVTVTSDRRTPTFTGITATPSRVSEGVVQIGLTASEPLSGTPAVTVNGNAATALEGSGMSYTYTYSVQASDPEGTATIVVSATDLAGNTGSATNQGALFIDRTAPVMVIDQPTSVTEWETTVPQALSWHAECDDLATSSAWVQMTASDDSVTTWEVVDGDSVSSEGCYVLFVTGIDLAGNVGETSSSFVIDVTAPVVTLTISAADPTNLAAIPFSAQFSEAVTGFDLAGIVVTNGTVTGFTQVGNRYDFEVIPASDGAVTVQVVAGAGHDEAGHSSAASELVTIHSDRTAPVFSGITATPPRVNGGTVQIGFTASESLNGAADVSVNGHAATAVEGSTSLCTYTIQASDPEGTATIVVSGTDAAGNTGSTTSTDALFVDRTASVMVIDQPTTASEWVATVPQTLRWHAECDDLATSSAWVQMTAADDSVTTWEVLDGDAVSSEGRYVLFVTGIDLAGNAGETSITLGIDLTPPSVTATAPRHFGGSEVPVSIVAGDTNAHQSGIERIEYRVDASSEWVAVPGTADHQTTVSASVTVQDLAIGMHTIYVRAWDCVAHASQTVSVTVEAFPPRPGIEISAPSKTLTGRGPVKYTVRYSGATAITLTSGDVALVGSGTASGVVAVANGATTDTRVVTISQITGDGTLGISLVADTAVDFLGHSTLAAGPSDRVVVDHTVTGVSRENAQEVTCGDTYAQASWGNAGYRSVNGYCDDAVSTVSGLAGLAGRWFRIPLPPGTGIMMTVDDRNGQTAVAGGFYDSCETTVAAASVSGVGVQTVNYANLTSQTQTVYALANHDLYSVGWRVAFTCSVIPLQLSGGWGHIVSLKPNGTLQAWGKSDCGQLGMGDNLPHTIPTTIPGICSVKEISVDGMHTLALLNDGTIRSFGSNRSGELGNGEGGDGTDTYNRNLPVSVLNPDGSLFTNVSGISCGGYHSLAVKSDGTVWGWGANNWAQLGDGTTTNRNCPVEVKAQDGSAFSGCVAVSTGAAHSVALRSDGSVWAWGRGSVNGSLGEGTDFWRRAYPVQSKYLWISLPLDNVTTIVARNWHNYALKSDGTVWAWGDNTYGQLGDGTLVTRFAAVQVLTEAGSPLRNVSKIVSGGYHAVALLQDGSVWTWGDNLCGELGDGLPMQHRSLARRVVESGAIDISGTDWNTFVEKTDGSIWGCGGNHNGELGIGVTGAVYNWVKMKQIPDSEPCAPVCRIESPMGFHNTVPQQLHWRCLTPDHVTSEAVLERTDLAGNVTTMTVTDLQAVSAEGRYTLNVRATNDVGTTSEWATSEFGIDLNSPSIVSPTETIVSISPSGVELQGTAFEGSPYESGLSHVEYLVEGWDEWWGAYDFGDNVQSESFSFVPGGLQESTNTVHLRAVDRAGNVSAEVSRTVYVVDATPPTVEIVSSMADVTNASLIPVDVIFSEPVTGFGPETLSVSNCLVHNFTGSGAVYHFDLEPESDGFLEAVIWEWSVQDLAGNWNVDYADFWRVVDRVPPVVVIDQPTSASEWVTTVPQTLSWHAECDDLMTSNAWVSRTAADDSVTTWEVANGDSVSSEGQYVLFVTGVDLATNVGETSRSFTVLPTGASGVLVSDECSDAIQVRPGDELFGDITTSATPSLNADLPPGVSPANDVWYRITIPADAVSTDIGVSFFDDPYYGTSIWALPPTGFIALYSGECGSLTCFDWCPGRIDGPVATQGATELNEATFWLSPCSTIVPGQTIYIRVGSNSLSPNKRLRFSCFNKLQW